MQRNRDRYRKELGAKTYDAADYKGRTQMSRGLAETHEQVSDTYMSGNNEETFMRDGKDLAHDNQE